ncbi:MAG TPA: tRNA (adenosine(37)-N6)-threonylcarbamoyltransferase complex dimerization subunit type 1 TsaB [Methylocella sp.]|nr:tRNA (adenosine(37)-N6)-threonylcarbamoyltransferase complex dimerization subunit type 1 TsaB [Methylocella sp.]
MRILAIDTALATNSACVFDEGAENPAASECAASQRGQAEALLPLIDKVMAGAEGGFASLDRVAVTVGPGSFTGLRIGIAAARAIGLACNIPVVGISTLAALAAPLILQQKPGLSAIAIDARHGHVFFAAFGTDGRTTLPARILPVREAVRSLGAGPVRLAGSGACLLAAEAPSAGTEFEIVQDNAIIDIVFVARIGLLADPAQAPPRPLYLKAPEAKRLEMAEHQPTSDP